MVADPAVLHFEPLRSGSPVPRQGCVGYWLLVWFIPIVGSLFALCQGFANMFFSGTQGPNRFDTPQSQAHIFD